MSDKEKQTTSGKLLIRTGGFALSLPVVVVLTGALLLVNFLLAVIIFGGLFDIGDTQGVISPYIPWLSLFLVLGIGTMFGLFSSVIRYMGGIGKLWSRLRGIQEEQARVDRLIDKQHTIDEVELLDADDDEQHQTKYQ